VISGSGEATVGYDGFGALRIDGLGRLFKLVFLATAALTVLIWATADSLVNESTTIRVSIQVSPSPANPGMLAEFPEGDVVTLSREGCAHLHHVHASGFRGEDS
jgi:hypothetical protein